MERRGAERRVERAARKRKALRVPDREAHAFGVIGETQPREIEHVAGHVDPRVLHGRALEQPLRVQAGAGADLEDAPTCERADCIRDRLDLYPVIPVVSVSERPDGAVEPSRGPAGVVDLLADVRRLAHVRARS
jgi:hypothetical protein